MRSIFLFLYVAVAHVLYAIPPEETYDTKSDEIRILKLLPGLFYSIAIDPAIPINFVAMRPRLDPLDWVYWGPKEVLEAYFKDPTSLTTPVIKVKLHACVRQTGPDSFNIEKEITELLKKQYPEDNTTIKSRWGSYPVFAFKHYQEEKDFGAWVGLNDPEGRGVLVFNLVCPKKSSHPTNEDCELWKKFLFETKQLPEPDFFKAYGQDLRSGYTIISAGGTKLKVTAEKRQRDGKLQVVVTSVTPQTTFQYDKMKECLLGSEWKRGEPLVKVYGTVCKKIGEKKEIMINDVISILLQTVAEFSVNKEKTKERKDLFIYQS